MKKKCIDCIKYKNGICELNLKNNYHDCKKFKPIPIDALIQEKNKLQVSQSDPVRLKYLIDRILFFDYGIC